MPTLWTQTLIPTARQAPGDAEVPSHQLMLRAGLIRKLGAGVYDYLPLGCRSLMKAMTIVRDEMARAGAAEVFLPTLQPIELWEQTGRRQAYGENLFVVKDRHGRVQALGPTHEEVITELVGAYVESYKQLPLTLYQIQTKFRDEFRPRFGVLRSREFQMKDAYSFHLTVDGPPGSGSLSETYDKQFAAYCRIFERCGLPYRVVEAESGPIGGSASHEFMVPSPTGEDTILESDKGNYAANVEKCEIGQRQVSDAFANCGHAEELSAANLTPAAPPTGELTKVHTPNCPGIGDVAKFMKTKPRNMLKTLVFRSAVASGAHEGKWVLAVVRGDHDVHEGKLGRIVEQLPMELEAPQLAEEAEARKEGFVIGYVGPHVMVDRDDVVTLVDPDAAQSGFWVTGANEPDHHVKHFDWGRDVLEHVHGPRVVVADIRNAAEGDPSPKNDGGVLRATKGIEIGHVFKLGDKYTRAMNITVLMPDNSRTHPLMGCYGIGINRILASAIERSEPRKGNDENGIIWPASIAPYAVLITPIKYDGQAKETADKLAAELEALSTPNIGAIDVLIDNREERPGVKFKDADLIGIPVRVTIGDKALAEGKVEAKARDGSNGPKGELVPIVEAARRVAEMLARL